MDRERQNKILPYLMLMPAMAVMAIVVIYPIFSCIVTSFTQEEAGGFGFENYLYFLADPLQLTNIGYTLAIVLVTVVLAVGIAYLLAIYLRFSNSRVSRWIGKLYLLPRFIPGLVAVNGMITIISNSGLLNRLSRLFGADWQLGLMYDAKGIVLMNLWFNIPFATMLMGAAMSAINNSEIEAARDVGAGKLRIFWKIILPLTYRDIFVSATFVFMGNISSFTTPYLMGGNHPTMMGVTMYNLYGNQHFGRSAALSVIMFILSALSAVMYIYVNMRKDQWEKN